MGTRIILKMPVSIEPSTKGTEFLEVSIKLPIFGLKVFDVPVSDAKWVVNEAHRIITSGLKK